MFLVWLVIGTTLLTFAFRVPNHVRPWLVALVAGVAIVAGASGPSFA